MTDDSYSKCSKCRAGRTSTVALAVVTLLVIGGAVWFFLVRKKESHPDVASAGDESFVDVARESGIDFVHENGAGGKRFMPEIMGGGAGWLDYDGDGFYDLYLVNGNMNSERGGAGDQSNRLFRNVGNGHFEDVTDIARVGENGYGMGVAVGDYDNDGWSDLYVTNYGENVLYRNEGGKYFRDVSKAARVSGSGWSTSATFVDIDSDGHLDLYVCRYVEYDPTQVCEVDGQTVYCTPKVFPGAPDLLFRNRGDGTFEDVSVRAGIAVSDEFEGKSLGVVALDYNDDGRSDIYVACDNVRNLLIRNMGDGTFKDVSLLASVGYSHSGIPQAGMGVDAGDVNLDELQDLVVTNFSGEPNNIYLAQDTSYFTESSTAFGLGGPSYPPLAFGVLFVDVDLDSDLDLYVGNGHVYDNVAVVKPGETFAQCDQLYENIKGTGLREVSKAHGRWFERKTVSRAVASADYDNDGDDDGDDDIAVFNVAEPATLLKNEHADARWIGFRLRGTKSNRDGYGTRVQIRCRRGQEKFTRIAECRSGRSYVSACDPRVRFGLGLEPGDGIPVVEEVTLLWPSGTVQTLESPTLDQYHEVVEPQ
jgi:hypothetical protein